MFIKLFTLTKPKYNIMNITKIKFSLILVIASIFFRMIWILFPPTINNGDGYEYHRLATSLSEGKGYINETGKPTTSRPPGWPLLLMVFYIIFGSTQFVARIVGLLLSTVTVILSYLLASKIYSEKIGRITGLIQTVFLGQFAYISSMHSEPLQGLLVILFLYFLIKKTFFDRIMSGIILGWLVLTRPSHIILILVVFIYFTHKKFFICKIEYFITVFVSMCIIVLPWTIRNYHAKGKFILVSTNSEINILIGNNPYATGKFISLDHNVMKSLADSGYFGSGYEIAMQFVKREPGRALINVFKKVGYLFFRDDDGIFLTLQNKIKTNSTIIFGIAFYTDIYWFLIMLTAVFAVIKNITKFLTINFNILIVLIILSIIVTTIFYFGTGRFHVCISSLMVMLSSFWISSLFKS
jgi:4-amino-4-deoxy-L-arabinose transferase-like glycosyltransferase